MVVVPLLPRVDSGPYDNWEDVSHFIWKIDLQCRNRKSELKEWCYINQLSIPVEVKNFDNKK